MQNIFNKLSGFIFLTFCFTLAFTYQVIANEKSFITHDYNQKLDISAIKERISSSDDLCMNKEEELAMVEEMQKFELGKFLLTHGGLNGKWTTYLIHEGPNKKLDNQLENWMVNHAPVVKATQERSKIFQKQINKYLHENAVVASLPCGTMHELYELNLDGVYDITLVGLDLDKESLQLAKDKFAPSRFFKAEFHQQDAWNLSATSKYNILVSNGLNIYEPDDNKVVDLYSQFHKSLIPGGVLITSFLTPSPEMSLKSTWKNYNKNDARKQKAIFKDIIQAKWQSFRTEDQTRDHLEKAGFEVIDVIYDSQGMFPTIVAQKHV